MGTDGVKLFIGSIIIARIPNANNSSFFCFDMFVLGYDITWALDSLRVIIAIVEIDLDNRSLEL